MEEPSEGNESFIEPKGALIGLSAVVVIAVFLASAALSSMAGPARIDANVVAGSFRDVGYTITLPNNVRLEKRAGMAGLLRFAVFRDRILLGFLEIEDAPELSEKGMKAFRAKRHLPFVIKGRGEDALLFRYILDAPDPERTALFERILESASVSPGGPRS